MILIEAHEVAAAAVVVAENEAAAPVYPSDEFEVVVESVADEESGVPYAAEVGAVDVAAGAAAVLFGDVVVGAVGSDLAAVAAAVVVADGDGLGT